MNSPSGLPVTLYSRLAGGHAGDRLANECRWIGTTRATDVAARVGIPFSARDRFDGQIPESGVTQLSHVLGHAAGAQRRTHAAQFVASWRESTPTPRRRLHGTVVEEDLGDLASVFFDGSSSTEHLLEPLVSDVAPDAADLAGAENDPAAGGRFDDVEHRLAHPPGVHKQTLEANRVRHQAQPEQVAVHA